VRLAARSESMAAVAEPDVLTLTALPPALLLHVFSLLPADVRARAACVCRGWRATLEEPSLWTWLDLSASSGVTCAVTNAVLAGAAAKARGQLEALDVSDCVRVSFDALLAVVQANAGALRKLRAGAPQNAAQTLDADRVERLLQAAPQLTACHAVVLGNSSAAAARRMLRNEAPFQPLRLRALFIKFRGGADEASVVTLAADMAAHASLQRVVLDSAPLHIPAALDAVVDAALAGQLISVGFVVCRLSAASALALVRLLGSGALTELHIFQRGLQLLDGPSAALLGAALLANATLTSLTLCDVGFWHGADAAAALLGALTGHASLRTLSLYSNHDIGAAHAAAAGAALGALVAANAPGLTELDVSSCFLNDLALGPLFAALPANTHLRTLNCSGNGMTDALARDVLLPAVRANESLRKLGATSLRHHSEFREAEALLEARAAAAAAAQ
jgi:hypothetical protein